MPLATDSWKSSTAMKSALDDSFTLSDSDSDSNPDQQFNPPALALADGDEDRTEGYDDIESNTSEVS